MSDGMRHVTDVDELARIFAAHPLELSEALNQLEDAYPEHGGVFRGVGPLVTARAVLRWFPGGWDTDVVVTVGDVRVGETFRVGDAVLTRVAGKGRTTGAGRFVSCVYADGVPVLFPADARVSG